jgi:hypothetical protein
LLKPSLLGPETNQQPFFAFGTMLVSGIFVIINKTCSITLTDIVFSLKNTALGASNGWRSFLKEDEPRN